MSQVITYEITPGSDPRWDSIFIRFPEVDYLVESIYRSDDGEESVYDLEIHLHNSTSNPFSLQEFIPGTPMRSAIEEVLDGLESSSLDGDG